VNRHPQQVAHSLVIDMELQHGKCSDAHKAHSLVTKACRLTHQDVVIASHRYGYKVDDCADAGHRLKILVDDEPPISD
jgi:hypothetical protein